MLNHISRVEKVCSENKNFRSLGESLVVKSRVSGSPKGQANPDRVDLKVNEMVLLWSRQEVDSVVLSRSQVVPDEVIIVPVKLRV